MRIDTDKIINVEPLRDSVSPEIRFDIPMYYSANYEMPIGSTGILLSEDNKKTSDLVEIVTDASKSFELAANEGGKRREGETTLSMVSKLDSIVLDHIEDLRSKNHRGKVKFRLEITVRTLNSRSTLSYMDFFGSTAFASSLPEHQKDAKFVIYIPPKKSRDRFVADRSNMWILSGDSSPTFLEIRNHQLKGEVTIQRDEWLQDFCPILKVGKFAVFEFQFPEYNEGRGDLPERINEAINAVEKMEEDLRKSEWNQVIEDSRAIWELLRDVEEIKDLLKRDGYTEEAINDLCGYTDTKGCKHSGCIGNLFNLSSKFHHKLDRNKKLQPEIKASKEDAYLVYTTGLAFANMISKKMQRLGID